MSSLFTLAKDLEQKSKAQQQSTGQMLKAAFSEHEKFVNAALNASAKRISSAISAHERGMSEAMQSNRLSVLRMVGRTWLTLLMVSVLLIASSGSVLWWQGTRIVSNLERLREQEQTQAILSAKNNGVQLSTCGDNRQRCVKVDTKAGTFGSGEWMILAGK
ncbi:MbeB-like, N-term conserved region [Serratia entomophila]|uniref:MbeB family mobilization protein n=1 Tax=Serratia entomophila TaxID=42906 RepID=UPI002176F44F|nr:MbeB family mobilization protein [Serratia entomophila]CAI1965127.1 MbeB-like, N-term conserved region [Serratia entomophila]